MVDPFSALGGAAAIAQLIQQSISLVNGARQIYQSTRGQTIENERLGSVIRELENLSKRIMSQKPRHEQSEAEKSLETVVSECQLLSGKILGLLKKIKAKDPTSIRSSAVAALRSAWNEKEKRELVEQAEKCRNLMHTQLAVIFESATIQRLEHIIKTGNANADELASLRQNTDALRSGIQLTEIGPEVEQQLCKLLHISDTALHAVVQHHILNSLYFGEMHSRLNAVRPANQKTFKWILEEVPENGNYTITKMKRQFKDWLISGNGIFHIAGKLGSGKSTLMKLLKKDHRTTELLEIWAAGRQLVIASFFFWKPGTEMENSIHGLLRTILWEVLKQCPELTPLVFPDEWQEVKGLPWQGPVKLRLDPDQIYNAFRRLIDCRNSDKSRCFCFFIDGLDEFERAGGHDYGYLVDLIQEWTRAMPENAQLSEDIKLCVSSREDNVFMESFADCPRIRLQDLNRADLVNFVRDRPESHRLFSTVEFTEDTTRDKFERRIVDQAAGVFLWATLAMITLREGLDNVDGLLELQSKLDSTPSDLNRLFRDLIAKIHEGDRQMSARTFSIISTLRECCQIDWITLFAYSFLDDFSKDPEFGIKLPTSPRMGDEQITRRLNRARKQLFGRCRGLAEITDHHIWPCEPAYFQTALQHRIAVVHRSIHEFLQSREIRDWMAPNLGEFCGTLAICQSIIAMIKLLSRTNVEDTDGKDRSLCVKNFHIEIWIALRCLSKNSPGIETQLKILDCLNEILPRPKWQLSNVAPKLDYHEPFRYDPSRRLPYFAQHWYGSFLSIYHAAAYVGPIEYVEWNFKTDRILGFEAWHFAGFLEMATGDPPWLRGSLLPILVSAFKRGLSPNMTSPQHPRTAVVDGGKDVGLSIWHIFFINTFKQGRNPRTDYFQLVELLLKFGADPRVSISSEDFDRVEDYCMMTNLAQYRIFFDFPIYNEPVVKGVRLLTSQEYGFQIGLAKLLRDKGGKISLRDWFDHNGGDAAKGILALIDRNMKLLEQLPTALDELPLLLAKEAESRPPSEAAEPSQSISGKEDTPETEPSKGAVISQLEKYVGERMAHILLDKLLGHPLAPFLLGILLTYLYISFVLV